MNKMNIQKGSPRFAVEAGLALILIILLIALIVGGYLIYQKQAKPVSQQVAQSTPTATSNPESSASAASPVLDNTVDNISWKIYETDKYAISYPSDWVINQETQFTKYNPDDVDIWSPDYKVSSAGFPLNGVHIIFFFAKAPFSDKSPGIVSKENIIWLGQKATMMVVNYEANDLVLSTKLNGKDYQLVMSSLSDEVRNKHKEVFLKIANTLKVK